MGLEDLGEDLGGVGVPDTREFLHIFGVVTLNPQQVLRKPASIASVTEATVEFLNSRPL